jgi:beta-lactamase regulating signal transducer with metallopeptidase domain
MRNWMTPIIYTLFALAVLYVGIQLFTNTSSFLSSMIMMIGIAVLVYGAIYFLFLRNRGFGGGGNRTEMKKYKQAVKQSKQKYKQPTPTIKKSSMTKPKVKPSPIGKKNRKRSSAPHLRVIEGNKDKQKNRATF